MGRFAKLQSAVLLGLNARTVVVESYVDKQSVNHNIDVVGLGDTAIKESIKRIKSAIKSNRFPMPRGRVVINLAPGDLKKEGTALDLPMAVSLLACSGIVEKTIDEELFFFGELSLDGKIRKIRGLLPTLIALQKGNGASGSDRKKVIVPVENEEEASLAEGLDLLVASDIRDVIGYLNGASNLSRPRKKIGDIAYSTELDFSEIHGQQQAKRAMEIAAAGGHNVLLKGPPGSGKTMLARRIPTILPPLTKDEFLETVSLYSISDKMVQEGLKKTRPFRAPHHSASRASITGGGQNAKPGEVSLAHNGVLFMDEIPEFSRDVLEALRQPMEDGIVSISRARLSVDYPANFTLVAAQNPCPCGNYGDPERECTCSMRDVIRYNRKISGPLLDRMDMIVEVPRMSYKEYSEKSDEESSGRIRERLKPALDRQNRRFEENTSMRFGKNSRMNQKMVKQYCALDKKSEGLLEQAVKQFKLTGRGINKILKVSRTIADIEGSDKIGISHLAEAIQYREKTQEE